MNPILYPQNETAFTSNGLGRMADAISCLVTEERNGQYELEMVYPISGAHYSDLALERILLARHNDVTTDLQPFTIYKITKPMNGKVTVNARHISYQLSRVTVMPMEEKGCSASLRAMKTYSVGDCPFTMWTDITSGQNKEFYVDYPSTFRSLLGGQEGSILDLFGGEFEWDKFTVKLHASRGTDTDVTLRYGKNLMDVKETKDSSSLYTGIVPFWKGQDKYGLDSLVTVEGDVVYGGNKDDYAYKMVIPMDLTSEFEEEPTEEDLLEAAQDYLSANLSKAIPSSIEVSFVHLWQTEEYTSVAPLQRLRLCDTVTIIHQPLGINYKAKIVAVTYDCLLERYQTMTIGEAKSTLSDGIKISAQEVTQDLPTMSAMQMAIAHATQLLTGGTGGYVVFGCNGDPESDEYIPFANGKKPAEIYIMDKPTVAEAVNVLRINVNGIGFSANGINGPYHSAWTLDGRFVADFITTGTLNAAQVDVVNLDASNITTGAFKILKKDENGNPILVNGKEQVLFLADADKGKVDIVADSFSFTSGETIESIAEDAVSSAIDSYDTTVQGYLDGFKDQLDKKVDWYFIHGVPTTETGSRNYSISPNREWTTDTLRQEHLGDCCYDLDGGKAYKYTYASYGCELSFTKESGTYNSADFVKVYYKKGTSYRMVGGWSGADLSCAKALVPTNDCYIYWHTNDVNNYAYGYKITGKREYVDPEAGVETVATDFSSKSSISATNNRVPQWGYGEKSGSTLESDHYPYSANMDDFYHWTISSASVSTAYRWIEIQDAAILKALGDAALAQDTADGKRRNFLTQPTPPYDVGDIWMDGKEIKACITARAQGASFNASDWVTKNEYIDKTIVDQEINKLDTKWSDEDTVFATLFTNGKRGFVFDPTGKKMYISMDLMKGGTIKLGGTTNNYGDGKFGIYDASGRLILWMDKTGFEMYNSSGTRIFAVKPGSSASTELGLYDASGNNIIWMDKNGIVVKNTAGTELMKINPTDGFMVGTANGWGSEIVQIKDAIIQGYLGTALKSSIDMVAQYNDGNGSPTYGLTIENNIRGVEVKGKQIWLSGTDAVTIASNKGIALTGANGLVLYSTGEGHPIDYYTSDHRFYGRQGLTLLRMSDYNSGSITAYVTTSGFSDRRAKENILPSHDHMEELRRLRVVSFDWREDWHNPGHVSAGLIAQEVQEILPELVTEDKDGMLGISFTGLVPFLLDAVQEKDREIQELKERTEALKKEVAGMKAHQEELEKRLEALELMMKERR